jgi:4-amino-4-deoxy-L-arabinose transferase-like glycosyltransferase
MDKRQRWDRSGFAAALLAGLLLRLVFLHFHPRFVGDALTYGDLAHNMLAHHTYGFTEGNAIRSTLIRLPGFPVFLAACFALFGDANYLAVLWVQIAVDLVTCALLGVLAARLMGRRAGLAAVWLAALCPFTANYAVAALTETLSLFCVVLAFFALERWVARWCCGAAGVGWAAMVGVAAAVAVLIRPDQGLVAASVVPVMVWVGVRHEGFVRGLGPSVVAMLIVALPLGLWAGRNWRVFHVVQPLAPRYANDPGEDVPYGFQRWYRTWAIDFKSTVDVYWNYDGNLMRMPDLPPRAFDDAEQLAQTRAVYAAYNAETSASPAFDAAFARIAAERIVAHPLRYYVLMPVARELNMWLRPRTELMKMPLDWWAVQEHPRKSAFEMAYALLNAAYLALALVGLWRWRGSKWTGNEAVAAAMIGFVALRCALLLTLDNSEPRYTLECFPVVILLAGYALARGKKDRASGQSASRTY